jgi:hypothetical protein
VLDTFSMLEAVVELSLVAVSVDPSVHAVALCSALAPLPDVGVSLGTSPDA